MLWYNPYCGVFGELKWFDIIAIVEFLENYTFREWRGKESTLELHTLRTVNSMTRKTTYLLSSHGKTKKKRKTSENMANVWSGDKKNSPGAPSSMS